MDKAAQTVGGPPSWIRVDDQGGIFMLTNWAQAGLHEQLRQAQHNVRVTLDGFSHVRGVILSIGTVHDTSATDSAGINVVRQLPGRRYRQTLIVPVEATRIVLRDHMELNPAGWYANEASWLDWARHELGHRPLADLLATTS